jgi:hypothetical protein
MFCRPQHLPLVLPGNIKGVVVLGMFLSESEFASSSQMWDHKSKEERMGMYVSGRASAQCTRSPGYDLHNHNQTSNNNNKAEKSPN